MQIKVWCSVFSQERLKWLIPSSVYYCIILYYIKTIMLAYMGKNEPAPYHQLPNPSLYLKPQIWLGLLCHHSGSKEDKYWNSSALVPTGIKFLRLSHIFFLYLFIFFFYQPENPCLLFINALVFQHWPLFLVSLYFALSSPAYSKDMFSKWTTKHLYVSELKSSTRNIDVHL